MVDNVTRARLVGLQDVIGGCVDCCCGTVEAPDSECPSGDGGEASSSEGSSESIDSDSVRSNCCDAGDIGCPVGEACTGSQFTDGLSIKRTVREAGICIGTSAEFSGNVNCISIRDG